MKSNSREDVSDQYAGLGSGEYGHPIRRISGESRAGSAEAIESLRPGEQECGFVRERWVPINRLTRRCRSTSGAHRLPLSTRSPLRRSRLSARIVRTLWDLSEQSFALSLNIAEVSRIPECSRSILYATT